MDMLKDIHDKGKPAIVNPTIEYEREVEEYQSKFLPHYCEQQLIPIKEKYNQDMIRYHNLVNRINPDLYCEQLRIEYEKKTNDARKLYDEQLKSYHDKIQVLVKQFLDNGYIICENVDSKSSVKDNKVYDDFKYYMALKGYIVKVEKFTETLYGGGDDDDEEIILCDKITFE
jgi:hypothetical protein